MLVVSFTSGTGTVRRFESIDRVSLVGNAVRLGSHSHSIASYAAGLWFFGSGTETFELLTVENRLLIHFEAPGERRCEYPGEAEGVEVVGAEIRLRGHEPIAQLDDRLQSWYRPGSTQAWPVVVFEYVN